MNALLVLFALGPMPSATFAAKPWSAAALGCVATLVAGLDRDTLPAPGECESEMVARTVRVLFERATCTGVIVSPRVIRTAGHCFAFGGLPAGVQTGDRRFIRANFTWAYQFTGPQKHDKLETLDQGELIADRDLNDLPSVPFVSAWSVDMRDAVVVAGYPGDGDFHAFLGRIGSRYRFKTWLRPVATYSVDGEAGEMVAKGVSGGPVFRASCPLALVGVASAFAGPWSIAQSPRPLRASASTHGELRGAPRP